MVAGVAIWHSTRHERAASLPVALLSADHLPDSITQSEQCFTPNSWKYHPYSNLVSADPKINHRDGMAARCFDRYTGPHPDDIEAGMDIFHAIHPPALQHVFNDPAPLPV